MIVLASMGSPPRDGGAHRRALACVLALGLVTSFGCDSGCTGGPTVDRRGRLLDAGADANASPDKTSPVIPEQEPNDTPSQANDYALIPTGPGSTVFKPFEGELKGANDVDFFRLSAQPDVPMRSLRVTPLSDGFDPVLLWGRADHRQNVAGPGDDEVASNLSNDAVIMGIAAPPGAKFPVRYRVTLTRSLQAQGLEVEPSQPEGVAVKLPGEVQGLINHSGDVDRYRVVLRGEAGEEGDPSASKNQPQGGEALRLELQPPPEVGLRVTLMMDGVSLESVTLPASQDARPEPLVWPNLGVGADNRELTVEIAAEPSLEGAAAAYTLRALRHPSLASGQRLEVEPSSALAPITVDGSAEILGYLHNSDDRDVFLVNVPGERDAPTIFHVRLSGEGHDWAMTLDTPTSPDGAQGGDSEPPSGAINDASPGQAEVICNRVVWPGETRLEINLKALVEDDDLKVAASNPWGRYRLQIITRPAEDEELEPNDQRADAAEIDVGASRQGFLYPVGDVDVYRFEVVASRTAQEAERAAGEGAGAPQSPEGVQAAPGERPAPGAKDPAKDGRPQLWPGEGGAADGEVKGGVKLRKLNNLGERKPAGDLIKPRTIPPIDLKKLGVGGGSADEAGKAGPSLWPADEAPAEEAFEVVLRSPRVNLALEVVDQDGLAVAQADRAPAGGVERLPLDLPPGVYFIKVKGGARVSGCDKPYTLQLKAR